jgi:hypothetical protein
MHDIVVRRAGPVGHQHHQQGVGKKQCVTRVQQQQKAGIRQQPQQVLALERHQQQRRIAHPKQQARRQCQPVSGRVVGLGVERRIGAEGKHHVTAEYQALRHRLVHGQHPGWIDLVGWQLRVNRREGRYGDAQHQPRHDSPPQPAHTAVLRCQKRELMAGSRSASHCCHCG